jgi:ABC-type ATPase involved in cell division
VSLLSFTNVTKCFPDGLGEITVLDRVSFEVDEGDFIGVWGMRRSGKSTLLQIAAGRLLPDEGGVRFDGEEVTRMSSERRVRLRRHGGIGLVSAEWRPVRNKPVVEHVAFPLLSDGMSFREAREPAWRALERMGGSGLARMPVDELSQLERIRVALAQALVREPRMLLFDEPAVLLRPSQAVELYELLGSLGRDAGLAVVIASEEISAIRDARRIFSIDSGRLRTTDRQGTLVQLPERARQRSRP